MSDRKGQNPKDLLGVKKVPLHLVPSSAVAHEAMAFMDGAAKYGPYNWRDNKVVASIYVAACKRHLDAWFDGEECASDSGANHLGHARACLGILLDALENDCLDDDRPPKGNLPELLERLSAQIGEKSSESEPAGAARYPTGLFVTANWITPDDPADTTRQGWVVKVQSTRATMTVLGESGRRYTCSDRDFAVVRNPPPMPAHVREALYGL